AAEALGFAGLEAGALDAAGLAALAAADTEAAGELVDGAGLGAAPPPQAARARPKIKVVGPTRRICFSQFEL
ncbi:MAG: hypothetical protein KGJ86_16930, partial [Chloroflexota bacterium]|nr:hypothetical protein [Chloroflexota bacterium]